MIRLVRMIAHDQRGTSVIEMGLALPLLGFMLVGMVDLSSGFAAKLKLEQAAQSTVEDVQQRGYTHNTTTTPTSLDAIEDEAEARAGTGAVATATAYRECSTSTARTKVAWTESCASGATTALYVSVSLAKTFTPMFSLRLTGANANGTYSLTGAAALRIQ